MSGLLSTYGRRYVPGWLVAAYEDAELAKEFLEDAILTQGVARDQLTIHADRGGSMRSKPVSQLMMDLGVTRSHSRPHVSNDNPFSEAAFKTFKYCPTFPERFGCIEDARAFSDVFFDHYNHVHRHSGIGLHTPASVHYGTHTEIREQRQIYVERRVRVESDSLSSHCAAGANHPRNRVDQSAN